MNKLRSVTISYAEKDLRCTLCPVPIKGGEIFFEFATDYKQYSLPVCMHCLADGEIPENLFTLIRGADHE